MADGGPELNRHPYTRPNRPRPDLEIGSGQRLAWVYPTAVDWGWPGLWVGSITASSGGTPHNRTRSTCARWLEDPVVPRTTHPLTTRTRRPRSTFAPPSTQTQAGRQQHGPAIGHIRSPAMDARCGPLAAGGRGRRASSTSSGGRGGSSGCRGGRRIHSAARGRYSAVGLALPGMPGVAGQMYVNSIGSIPAHAY